MIDIKHLREHPDLYRASAKLRGITTDIDALLAADIKRTKLIGEVEALRAKLNVKGKPTPDELTALQETKAHLEKLETAMRAAENAYTEHLSTVPNLLAEGTPEGGEDASREEKTWGSAEKRDVKDHLTLGEEQGWIDFERGAKVAGSKFYFLKGPILQLELAMYQMALRKLMKHGFAGMITPHMVNTRTLEGTGFQPRGEEDQTYRIEGEDLAMIGTAEIPLTGYHADEIIDPAQLPLAYVGLSPAYRKEAGAYGKHSKGLYRVHQFNKLEMYVFCAPEESEAWHDKLLQLEEEIYQELEIPYRVVRIAAGDLGAPAYKKYDLEYWSPVDGSYREITSCSNVTDYQARRLNIRTRDASGKTTFVHTLNGTAIAFSRALIALIENHQTAEGNVRIPEALQPYYGSEMLQN